MYIEGKLGVGLRIEDIRRLMDKANAPNDEVPFVLPEWIVKEHEHIQTFRRQNCIHESVELRFDVRDSRIVFTIMDKDKMVDACGRHYSPEGSEGSLIRHLLTVPRSGKGMAILAERTLVEKVRQLSLLRTVSRLPKHCTFNAQDSLSWGQLYLGNTSSNYKVTHVS